MNEKELVEAAVSCLSNEDVTLFTDHKVALFPFFPKLLQRLRWLLLFNGNIIIIII